MAVKDSNPVSLVGGKIRQMRILRDMTQKELAEKSSMSESAIRNYELGNRYPDQNALERISEALKVDLSYLLDADPYSVEGALQILFQLETLYGLSPEVVGDDIHLVFGPRPSFAGPREPHEPLSLRIGIAEWMHVRKMYISGKISSKEYFEWLASYPAYAEHLDGVEIPFDRQEEARKYSEAEEIRDEEIRQITEEMNNDPEELKHIEELLPKEKPAKRKRKPAKPKI